MNKTNFFLVSSDHSLLFGMSCDYVQIATFEISNEFKATQNITSIMIVALGPCPVSGKEKLFFIIDEFEMKKIIKCAQKSNQCSMIGKSLWKFG